MNLKKELIVVFHPYSKPGHKRPFRYRVISANSLPNYIGQERMDKEVEKFFASKKDKTNFYVKLCGWVYLYRR